MMRPLSLRWLVLFAVIVLAAACSSDDGACEGTATQSERTAATLQAEVESAAMTLSDPHLARIWDRLRHLGPHLATERSGSTCLTVFRDERPRLEPD